MLFRPKMIIAGASAYPREWDYANPNPNPNPNSSPSPSPNPNQVRAQHQGAA